MPSETFSYLPPLTDAEVRSQIAHLTREGLDPRHRVRRRSRAERHYWSLWKLPFVGPAVAGRGAGRDRPVRGRQSHRGDQAGRLRQRPPGPGRGVRGQASWIEWADASTDHPGRRWRLGKREDDAHARAGAAARARAGVARLPRRLPPLRPLAARRHGDHAAAPGLQLHGHHGPAPQAAALRRGRDEAGLPPLRRQLRAARVPGAAAAS